MALQYNSFMNQDDFIREPKIRVYVNESNPSSPRERRVGDKERYPSLYKIFNNKPSFGESGVITNNQKAVPVMVEPVKYSDYERTRSPQHQVAVPTQDVAHEKAKFVGYKNQAPVPLQEHIISYPKVLPEKVVESVKYDDVGNDGKKKGEVGEIECINAAAAGFIEWKRRTLAMCKAVNE